MEERLLKLDEGRFILASDVGGVEVWTFSEKAHRMAVERKNARHIAYGPVRASEAEAAADALRFARQVNILLQADDELPGPSDANVSGEIVRCKIIDGDGDWIEAIQNPSMRDSICIRVVQAGEVAAVNLRRSEVLDLAKYMERLAKLLNAGASVGMYSPKQM